MTDDFKKLAELASKLPIGLRADWKYNNHYELHSNEKGEYFWWDLAEVQDPTEHDTQSTLAGQRLGLIMDIAEEVAILKDNNLLK